MKYVIFTVLISLVFAPFSAISMERDIVEEDGVRKFQVAEYDLLTKFQGPISNTSVYRFTDHEIGSLCYVYAPDSISRVKKCSDGMCSMVLQGDIGSISCFPHESQKD